VSRRVVYSVTAEVTVLHSSYSWSGLGSRFESLRAAAPCR
jgi:hypothetical protein